MEYPKVAIIIINWNDSKDTIECLESLFQLDYHPLDLVVVDNNSSDGSAKEIMDYILKSINTSTYLDMIINYEKINIVVKKGLKGKENQIHFIENQKNTGFTGGNNIGIHYAMKYLNPSFVLLLNNDTVVDKDVVKNLILHVTSNNKIAITTGKVLLYSDKNKINTVGNKMDVFGGQLMRGVGEEDVRQYDFENPSDFFYAAGPCMMMSCEFIAEVGKDEFFDSALFAYHDDVDASWMARLLGWKITYCPGARIYHKWGQSFSKVESTFTYYLTRRNQICLILKNYQLRTMLFILPMEFCILIICDLILSIRINRKYFKVFLNAIYWNTVNLTSIIQKRRVVQSKRTLPDRALMKMMDFKSYEFKAFVDAYKKSKHE